MTANLETVATFHDLTQAQAARAALEGEGISAELLDENTGSIDWGLMPAMGGLRLQVSKTDAPRALEILEQLVPEQLEEESEASSDEDDGVGYREASGQRKRRAALVALMLLFIPAIIAVVLSLVAWLFG